MLARQQTDASLARRQPSGPSTSFHSSAVGRPSVQPVGPSSSPSLNMKPARVVGTQGTAYEAMCKRVLGRRLFRAFCLACFASTFLWNSSLSLTSRTSLISSFFGVLRDLVTSAVIFALCVLPTLVLRKILITQSELTTSSASARLRTLATSPSSRTAVLVFTVCGGLLAFFWTVSMQILTPDVKLGVFAPTSKHPVQLNERYIVVLLSNISLGLAYASRELWQEAFLPKWPRDIIPLQGLILSRLSAVPGSFGLPIVHSFAFSAGYLALRKPVLRFLLSWFGVIVRPYVVTFLRSSHRSMDFSLLWKIVILEITTVALWESGKAFLDVYMVQPMLISQHSASPTKCLLAGLELTSPYFRHFAQFELAHLIVTSPQRRLDIFSDMSTPNTAWSEIWRTEMVLLGKSYQTLLDRGLPARPAVSSSWAASNGASATSFEQSPKKHLVPKSDPSIFIHSTKTVYDSLSSSPTQSIGPTPPPQPAPRAPVTPPAPSNVPAIFTQRSQSTESPVASSPAKTSLPPSSSTLGAIQRQLLAVWSKVWSGVPPETRSSLESNLRPIREVLVRERVRGSSRQPLPHRDLDMLVIQTLSALSSASLAEDPYGQVQRDIPKTLEALTAFLGSLESLYAQLQAASSTPDKWVEEGAVTMAVLKEDLEPVLDATREGIRQIVETFREHLSSAFKFPPHVVKALEQFVD